jgi:4-hydroxy-3-methylbut-2-enyl diphosphate reductase
VRTGVGPVRSRRATRRLREDPADFLVVAGLCGAADPNLAVGDVVVASALRRLGAPPLPVETECMCRALEMQGVRAQLGSILSVDHVVRGLEREAVFAEGAVAVDMESAWLAEAANGRPLGVVRVVLDAPAAEIHPFSILKNGWLALASLRRLAPAFQIWASLVCHRTGEGPSSRVLH